MARLPGVGVHRDKVSYVSSLNHMVRCSYRVPRAVALILFNISAGIVENGSLSNHPFGIKSQNFLILTTNPPCVMVDNVKLKIR